MDSFEFNKIAAAFLTTALVFIGIKEIGNALYHVENPEKSAYVVEGVEVAASTCLLYTSPSPRDRTRSRMPSSA